MTELELQTQIETLRSRIAQHQKVITNLEQQKAQLELPPPIPPQATASELVEIFESAATRLDELEGAEAAAKELERRTARLQAQLQQYATELHQLQAQAHQSRIQEEVLNAIAK